MTDVDLERGTLTIHNSKRRTRIVLMRDDLARESRRYIDERRQLLIDQRRADPGAMFVRRNGSPLTTAAASNATRRMLRHLGIKPAHGRTGSRPYEFRHAFAVYRLTLWAREGVDIHSKLPLLSAYLGHENIIGSEVYLKAKPQLLELASWQARGLNSMRDGHVNCNEPSPVAEAFRPRRVLLH
jgi:integrase/recombinase XerD